MSKQLDGFEIPQCLRDIYGYRWINLGNEFDVDQDSPRSRDVTRCDNYPFITINGKIRRGRSTIQMGGKLKTWVAMNDNIGLALYSNGDLYRMDWVEGRGYYGELLQRDVSLLTGSSRSQSGIVRYNDGTWKTFHHVNSTFTFNLNLIYIDNKLFPIGRLSGSDIMATRGTVVTTRDAIIVTRYDPRCRRHNLFIIPESSDYKMASQVRELDNEDIMVRQLWTSHILAIDMDGRLFMIFDYQYKVEIGVKHKPWHNLVLSNNMYYPVNCDGHLYSVKEYEDKEIGLRRIRIPQQLKLIHDDLIEL